MTVFFVFVRVFVGTKTLIFAAVKCLESVVSDKSISEHLVLRLVIGDLERHGKLDVGNLEVGNSIRQGMQKKHGSFGYGSISDGMFE